MLSVKFEIGFCFDGKAGWNIIPYTLQTDTNGYEYYWSFETELNSNKNFCDVKRFIDGYLDFLYVSMSTSSSEYKDDLREVKDILYEQNYLDSMKFGYGFIDVDYEINIDKVDKGEPRKPTKYDIKFQNELDEIFKI